MYIVEPIWRLTFVWDSWLSGLCTGIPVIDPEFDPGHESVVSHSFFLFRPVLVDYLTACAVKRNSTVCSLHFACLKVLFFFWIHKYGSEKVV